MALELGDHVWYWNRKISLDKSVPRAQWFPGSNPNDPNDYQGHGREIFHYVVHADEIARGRPHMRNLEGSFAWLNNNPGNITGIPGGPDFGQYHGKFNWHNFLIFPTWAAGYNAIALYLRSPQFVNLSILDAFKKYAPESDGNNPVAYANAVAAGLGVPVSTRVGDLDDAQMWIMQEKIQEIEGVIPGESLSWDSDEIPQEIADQLPTIIREARRPRAIYQRSEPFSIDISAPVDTSGFTSGLGGPNQGGHVGSSWYIRYGMDIGAEEGTLVYAAFDGHITRLQRHNPASDSGRVYGAQIFMRAPNDMMGGFYTHLTDVPAALDVNSMVARGDLLGRVYKFGGISPHLHLALVEIIGGAPSGQYIGVDLYQFFLRLQSSEPETVVPVQFWQDGSPPEPTWRATRLGAVFARDKGPGIVSVQRSRPFSLTIKRVKCYSTNDLTGSDDLYGVMGPYRFRIGSFAQGDEHVLDINVIVPVNEVNLYIVEHDVVTGDDNIGIINLTENMDFDCTKNVQGADANYDITFFVQSIS